MVAFNMSICSKPVKHRAELAGLPPAFTVETGFHFGEGVSSRDSMSTRKFQNRSISRRDALGTLGALGVMTLVGGSRVLRPARAAGASVVDGTCTLTPEMTIGPYFVDERLQRSDIREDGAGTPFIADALPLYLTINATSSIATDCPPLAGVQIDVWHCHAGGLYSDEQANGTIGETWLRGYQLTDANGNVTFTTIYPGWYAGRTIHIHAMARYYDTAGNTTYQFTTQLFFDDATSDIVLANYPYNTRGNRTTTNQNDGIYDAAMLLNLTSDGSAYTGTITLGLELEGTSLSDVVFADGFESA
jgi:protocatechuate 3,4-dioxygenase beta subunit